MAGMCEITKDGHHRPPRRFDMCLRVFRDAEYMTSLCVQTVATDSSSASVSMYDSKERFACTIMISGLYPRPATARAIASVREA